ncbi:unnamed protein product [marine sediment metagenome]|uniref:Uncharacterized protein n=1 Tax=marine sediment metagenome TaxID=412755 RepID=X1CU04_9ZZZZ
MKCTIKSELTEQDLIEGCLNLWHSGYDYKIPFMFHALANSWHYNKLFYYMELIEGTKK